MYVAATAHSTMHTDIEPTWDLTSRGSVVEALASRMALECKCLANHFYLDRWAFYEVISDIVPIIYIGSTVNKRAPSFSKQFSKSSSARP